MISTNTQRRNALGLLVLVTVAGFVLKYYSGPFHLWPNDYGAAVLYEIFFCVLAFIVWPSKKNAGRIAGTVFLATCALEVAQLYNPPWLAAIRATPPGQWLLGTTFVWWDFPHYLLGSALGWGAIRLLARTSSTARV